MAIYSIDIVPILLKSLNYLLSNPTSRPSEVFDPNLYPGETIGNTRGGCTRLGPLECYLNELEGPNLSQRLSGPKPAPVEDDNLDVGVLQVFVVDVVNYESGKNRMLFYLLSIN